MRVPEAPEPVDVFLAELCPLSHRVERLTRLHRFGVERGEHGLEPSRSRTHRFAVEGRELLPELDPSPVRPSCDRRRRLSRQIDHRAAEIATVEDDAPLRDALGEDRPLRIGVGLAAQERNEGSTVPTGRIWSGRWISRAQSWATWTPNCSRNGFKPLPNRPV